MGHFRGPILIEILQILDKLTLPGDEMNSESRQKIIEAFKFAYVDRMKLGDPAFVANVTDIVNELISCERACSIAPRIHGVLFLNFVNGVYPSLLHFRIKPSHQNTTSPKILNGMPRSCMAQLMLVLLTRMDMWPVPPQP